MPLPATTHDRLLTCLDEGGVDLLDIARECKVSFTALHAWLQLPQVRDVIDAVMRVSQVHMNLMIAQYRALAVGTLGKLVQQDTAPPDVLRKAATTVLKTSPGEWRTLPIIANDLARAHSRGARQSAASATTQASHEARGGGDDAVMFSRDALV